jgi:prepilin-type N-terminal cleavage/methylation domain-containing protein
MRLKNIHTKGAFTLAEMLVAISIGSVILAAIAIASVSMQKSLNAADNFFGTQMQQIRIIDYLNRDVKRSYIVTASADLKTVTCVIPNYLNGNVRTTPTVKTTETGTYVSYPYSRTVTDGVTTSGSATLTSASASFTSSDVGASVAGANIPTGTKIQAVTNSTTITMSASATASTSNATATFGATTVVYSINGNSIVRTENGVVTNIASSTDQLLPQTTDVTLSNTEYTTTSVVFQPVFTSGSATAEQTGTTVFTTSYLRNKRRG